MVRLHVNIFWNVVTIIAKEKDLVYISVHFTGLHNPLDTLYHLQPFMTLTLMPLAFYIEGKSKLKRKVKE